MDSIRITGKDHSQCLTDFLRGIYHSETYYDVTLMAYDARGGSLVDTLLPERKAVRVNRILMAAASPVFQKIFECQAPPNDDNLTVFLEGYSYLAVHEMVHMVYHGYCPLIADMNEVVSILSDFQIAIPPSDSETGTTLTSLIIEERNSSPSAAESTVPEALGHGENPITAQENVSLPRVENIAGVLIVPTMGLNVPTVIFQNGGSTPQVKITTCTVCGKTFRNKSRLRRHMLCHVSEKPCMCEICGKTFKDEVQVRYHQRNHQDLRRYACSTCGKKFKRREHLTSHLQQHTGFKPYVCEVCGKSFSCRRNLKGHVEKHGTGKVRLQSSAKTSESQNLSCSYCNKTFTKKFVLENHLRTHTGERPFSCNQCGKQFAQKVTLQTHLRTHGQDKAHNCNLCGKSFAQKVTLTKHIAKVHGEQDD